MKHSNISIFIPHNGCPCRCSFCNQNRITGVRKQPSPQEVEAEIASAAEYMGDRSKNTEIAFFGGSFTAIDRNYMTELLRVASSAVKRFGFLGVRCSTRPDAIDPQVLSVLRSHSVTAIELGAQSMVDRVLFMNDRGHSSKAVEEASALIKSFGFELGLQMMTGLYGSTPQDDMETARRLIELQPDTVRIYPTITLENTKLSQLFRDGEYRPQSLEEAVELCAKLIPMFEDAGIRVIRVGLHASEELDNRVAGPYHPAFRELCTSKQLFDRITAELPGRGEYLIRCSNKLVSAIVGQKRCNLRKWEEMGISVKVMADEGVKDYNVEKM